MKMLWQMTVWFLGLRDENQLLAHLLLSVVHVSLPTEQGVAGSRLETDS